MTRITIDAHYLARREAQERAAAQGAGDPAARRRHLELADLYAERKRGGTGQG